MGSRYSMTLKRDASGAFRDRIPPAKQKLLTVSWRISPSRSLKNNGSDTQPGDEHRSGNCYRGKASNLTQVLSFQAVGQGSEQRHVVSR
jgi:hypothetical protein